MNKDIKLLIENIFQREGARELLKRSKAEEIDAQIRKMYLYHPKTKEELEYNIIECFKNETDLNLIDVSDITDFMELFNEFGKIGKYIKDNGITSIDISGWYIRSDANVEYMFKFSPLEEIVLPNNLQKIENFMFYESSLTSVTIPNSVTSIGQQSFYDCSELTSVTIPKSVTSISESAFLYCSGLTSIKVEDGNPVYVSGNDCNTLIETATNTLLLGCKSTVIPNSVTSIGHDAFSWCSGLTSLDIPNSVTSIGDYAFNSCSRLTSVTIPDSVTEIGEWAFAGCVGLTSVDIPATVASIGNNAFSDCRGLTIITILKSFIDIADNAFDYCGNLQTIYVDDVEVFKSKCSNVNFNGAEIKSIKEKPINEKTLKRTTIRH